jgi:hypothetical protein
MMLRSIVAEDVSEFDQIRTDVHIAEVYDAISTSFERYYDSWVSSAGASLSLAELSTKFRVKVPKRDDKPALQQLFSQAIDGYTKMQAKYEAFFDRDALQEYQDVDPTLFKSNLSKHCPVVHRCVYSTRPEMAEWQMKFKDTPSQELLDIFVNLVNFADEYAEECDLKKFKAYDDFKEFGFEPLDEDESYSVQGVIGMGIKSEVLYHLYPQIFPKRGRLDVYGLYFLSGMEDFGLQGKNSEFLMINDMHDAHTRNLKMDHNYWYPYGLFSLYIIRLTRLLAQKGNAVGLSLDDKYRFVYVGQFLAHVCEENRESMEVMLGGLQD